jgi:hypothetical protein
MEDRCHCGNPIAYPFDQLGCIQCGQACCPACGVSLESAMYCAGCANALMDVVRGDATA